ncbi:Vasoactive intestinal polypeptide receptor, partial [Larimichthys crocea]
YVKTMYTAGYTLSLITLTIAITIFCLFRKLHCTRNYIHIQMFISFILRAIFIFIRDSLLFTNEEHYHCDYYPVACKVVLMLTNYSILANYSWLLMEGHFLFTLVSRSFFSLKKHLAWYIVLGWGATRVSEEVEEMEADSAPPQSAQAEPRLHQPQRVSSHTGLPAALLPRQPNNRRTPDGYRGDVMGLFFA